MSRLLFLIFVGITGSACSAEPNEPILIAKPDVFKTLVNPNCSHCRDEAKRRAGELKDDDRVLCWIRGYSDGGAIPHRFFLNNYRVISDSYGVFVFDADAGYSRGFEPSYDFTFFGWRNGVMVMKHKDGTLYSCLTGVGFEGPRKGKKLQPVPTLVSDWGYWLKQYPQAVAYHMFDKYQPLELPAHENKEARKSRPPADDRLPTETMVVGVVDGTMARAYPIDDVAKAGLISETVGTKARAILWYGPTRTAAAFELIATPATKDPAPGKTPRPLPVPKNQPSRAVTLELAPRLGPGPGPFIDKETKSSWDIAGRAIAGELKGWKLNWLDSTQVKWYAWAAEYPKTDVYGR